MKKLILIPVFILMAMLIKASPLIYTYTFNISEITIDTTIGVWIGDRDGTWSIQCDADTLISDTIVGDTASITVMLKNEGHGWAEVINSKLPQTIRSYSSIMLYDAKLSSQYIGFKVRKGITLSGELQITILIK